MFAMKETKPQTNLRQNPRKPTLARKCTSKDCPLEKETSLLQRRANLSAPSINEAPPIVHDVLRSSGQPLDDSTRAFMEPRFNQDFSHVRVHTDAKAAESAHAVNALAYTVGRDIVMRREEYVPTTDAGKRLLAHELVHVIQQGRNNRLQKLQVGAAGDVYEQEADRVAERVVGGGGSSWGAGRVRVASTIREQLHTPYPIRQPYIQRTLGDGHDLTSPRFSRLLDLEAAYDNETVIRNGSSSRGVQAIQQALYDLGYPLPEYGADGKFGEETKVAVKAFQIANPPLIDDGEVGPLTMAALNARFSSAPALPSSAVLSAPWTDTCVLSVLCPWSPHTIDVLRTRITLKSFDSISWADEEWNGVAWISAPFPGGGYNTGTEIGVLNESCEEMSETLYHEVLHAEQPKTHRTTLERESYAYRIGEEFSIAMGLGGRPSLRSTDTQGREFADPTKVGTFVSSEYPSVPTGGGGDEIIGKAATHGHVRVQRTDGSIYTRPAVVGEKVPGPINLVNEVTHRTTGWTCP
jgi:hypothetical protein